MSELLPSGSALDVQASASEDSASPESYVRTGLWLAAARCVITYVVGPILGAWGILLSHLGVTLQIIGVCTATYGALQLRRRRHPWWVLYALIACSLLLATVATVAM